MSDQAAARQSDATVSKVSDKAKPVASESAGTNKADSARSEEPDEATDSEAEPASATATKRRGVTVSLRSLLVAAVVLLLIASHGLLIWLYLGVDKKLNAQNRQAADNSHAEKIALDYAVGAAKIKAQDLGPWKNELVKGTTPELKEKLTSAANSMEQILTPLQWNSTAVPLTAKVRSNANGIYIVDTFVGVETKTIQAPDSLQSTATYSVTIDSNHDWLISDVGGIGTVVGKK